MKLSFFIGLVIAIMALITGYLLNDYKISLKITGFVSADCIIVCGILNG